MNTTTLNILIIVFGAWRISSLVANENGPFYIFVRLRDFCLWLCEHSRFCKEFHLHELIECEWCNSIWIGFFIIASWFFWGNVIILALSPFALSATVIFLKFIIQDLQELLKLLNKLSS